MILVLALGALLVCGAAPAGAHPPATKPATVFASGVSGPEGLAFTNDGFLVVGSTTGEIRRYGPGGIFTVLANVGERLAGLTVTKNNHVLAAAFNAGNVWMITPAGAATVLASGIGGPNFIVQTRRGQILVSASTAGTIVDVTSGAPVVRASGLSFPNGMAIGRDHHLYVAETGGARVSRLRLNRDGSLGAAEIYAEGLPLVDGIAFDRSQNLLAVGFDTLRVIDPRANFPLTMTDDALFDWPSNIAFGRGRGFDRRDLYLANFGPGFGNGTTVIKLRFNHTGTRLIR
jgi:sugar lactone lactonase YvrE